MQLAEVLKQPVGMCGHVRLVTECDDCWERVFAALCARTSAEIADEAETRRVGRETAAANRSFNAQGCEFCGHVSAG